MVYLLILVSHLNDRAAGVYRVPDVATCQSESEKIRAQLPAGTRVLLAECRDSALQARADLSAFQCVFGASPKGDKFVYVYNCGRVSLPPDSQVLPPGDHTAYMVLSQQVAHDNMARVNVFAPAVEGSCQSHAALMLSKQAQVRGVKTLYARCMEEEAVRQQLSGERCTVQDRTHPEMYDYVCNTNLQVAPAAQVLPKEE